MSFTIYFLLFSIIVFIISAYFIITCPLDLIMDNHSVIQQGSNMVAIDGGLSSFSFFNFINSRSKKSKEDVKKEQDSEEELIKASNQLKRDLMTLNYIAYLQANPKIISDPKRLEEIKNLKEGIERQIVKNTKFLNDQK